MSTLSEAEFLEIVQRVVRRIMVVKGLSSPSAGAGNALPKSHDFAADSGTQTSNTTNRTIALGADHGGFTLKENLKVFLQKQGYQVIDCGTFSSESVDYPDFAYAVAKLVSEDKVWRGIIIDGAGIGSCMVANKVKNVRASMCYDHATAVNSREHNNANVLTLGAGMIDLDMAHQIVNTWLITTFAGGRHARRVDKIMAIEK